MATTNAIASVSSTLARMLANADGATPRPVRIVHASDDLTSPPAPSGFGLFLYRITPSTERRAVGQRVAPDGTNFAPTAYADLSYLVVAWAADGAEQHRLLGAAIRAIEDGKVLDAGALNAATNEPVFGTDESVEVIWESVGLQELANIWMIAPKEFRAGVGYVVRAVPIDSARPIVVGSPVTERDFAYTPVAAR